MNSPVVTPGTYQLGATSAYTVFQPMSEGSVSFGQMYTSTSSWRKFIRTSIQQPESASVVTVAPAEYTTTKGPTILKPIPLPEDYDAQIEAFFRFIDSLGSETETTDDITAEQ
jgi:hypothetical protein